MLMMFLWLIFTISLTIGYLVHLRSRRMSILARNNIPGPKPSLIYGNLLEAKSNPRVKTHEKWMKEYGKVFGYYFGVRPQVVVGDIELVKAIQIKDFNQFADRPHLLIKDGFVPHEILNHSLIREEGKRWKEMRSVLTPTFSAAKLKAITPTMNGTIEDLLVIIGEKADSHEEFDIYESFQRLTSDVIGRVAFGIATNVQRDPEDKFLKASKMFFNFNINQFMLFVLVCFPILDKIIYPYRWLKEEINSWRGESFVNYLINMCHEIITTRRSNLDKGGRRRDLLQLMLDARMSNQELRSMKMEQLEVNNTREDLMSADKDQANQNTSTDEEVSSSIRRRKADHYLTDDEIVANSVIFFEAGYETTSTALGFIAHILVNHLDVQEKIREEVVSLLREEGKLDYNTVTKLSYMECVINETMRVYPPVTSFITREALTDYTFNSITIPKGAQVIIPVSQLHHDPDLWSEPEKFDPSRFSFENRGNIKPCSFQPFGNGPRNCIGMRFALLEMKLALAKLLVNFKLVPGPKTEIGELSVSYKIITMTPKDGVFLKVERI